MAFCSCVLEIKDIDRLGAQILALAGLADLLARNDWRQCSEAFYLADQRRKERRRESSEIQRDLQKALDKAHHPQ